MRNACEQAILGMTHRFDFFDFLFQLPILGLILDILRTSGNTHYAALLLLAFILGRRRRVVSSIRSRVRRARGRRTGQHGGDKGRRGGRSEPRPGLAVMLFGVESFRMNFPYSDALRLFAVPPILPSSFAHCPAALDIYS